jgi:hypothetical protein
MIEYVRLFAIIAFIILLIALCKLHELFNSAVQKKGQKKLV